MTETRIRTRFAPSPTGYLHVGGARTALFNWLFARSSGGNYILRVEDTDAARNTEEATAAIFDGLKWLGLDWDGETYYQSQRQEIYAAYLGKLESAGHVYEDDGAIRFRFPDREITVSDLICGQQSINLAAEGASGWDAEKKEHVEKNPDLVIRRPDGSFLFHFVNVVDDIEMGVTHVIRGEDHLSNTPKHVALYEALGADVPVFAHIPLILNKDGSKMSKRDTGASVSTYREEGFLPDAVCNYLALLGWSSGDDREVFSLSELVEVFDMKQVNRSNAKFDMEKCMWLNGQYVGALDPADFITQAQPFAPDAPEGMLELTQPRVRRFCEVADYLNPILNPDFPLDAKAGEKVAGKAENADYLGKLASALDGVSEWSVETIKGAVSATAEELGVKMGALMFPLRIATMGTGQGVDLAPALELVGREDTVARIRMRIPLIFAERSAEG